MRGQVSARKDRPHGVPEVLRLLFLHNLQEAAHLVFPCRFLLPDLLPVGRVSGGFGGAAGAELDQATRFTWGGGAAGPASLLCGSGSGWGAVGSPCIRARHVRSVSRKNSCLLMSSWRMFLNRANSRRSFETSPLIEHGQQAFHEHILIF